MAQPQEASYYFTHLFHLHWPKQIRWPDGGREQFDINGVPKYIPCKQLEKTISYALKLVFTPLKTEHCNLH